MSWEKFPLAHWLRNIDFRFWIPLLSPVFSTLVLGLSLGLSWATFWENFFPHRTVLITVGREPVGSTGGYVKPEPNFNLPVIVSNTGNRTELILCVRLTVIPSAPPGNEYQSSLFGPYVLKAGDAVTAPLSLSHQRTRECNR